ncbi:hypothetical protein STENM36S_03472 [Streptomyces tendae]
MRGDRGGAAAPADQDRGVGVEAVLAHQVVHDGLHLVGAGVQQPGGGGGHVGAEGGGERGQRGAGGVGVGVGEVPFGDPAQRVGGAGHGEGEPAARRVQDGVVGGVAGQRTDRGQLGVPQVGRVGITGVRQPGDVRAARSGAGDPATRDAHHGAAADADGTDVQGVEVGGPAEQDGVPYRDLAAPDDADVGRGAAGLQEHALADPFLHQRPGDPGGRPGQHGQQGPAAHLVQGHHSPVAAHHHQRRGDTGLGDGGVDEVGGGQHARQDRRVDDGGAGAFAQPVQGGDLVRGGGRQAGGAGRLGDRLLALGPVDAEGLAGHQGLGAGGGELFDGGPYGGRVLGVGHVRVVQRQPLAGGEFELGEGGEPAGEVRSAAGADAEQADGGDVALQQGVGSLGGAVCQEGHVGGCVSGLLQQPVERLDDAVRDTVLVMVTRGDLHLAHEPERRGVDRHGVGEGSAHVDADADAVGGHVRAPPCAGSVHARAVTGRGRWCCPARTAVPHGVVQ